MSVRADDDAALHDRVAALALDLPPGPPDAAWALTLHDGRLALAPTGADPRWDGVRPLSITFDEGALGFRLARAQHEAVVRAVRGRQRDLRTLIDGTAGMGRDGLLLAAAGLEVSLVEANPWVHALLADAVDRLRADPSFTELAQRITLHAGRTEEHLAAHTAEVVYLDPMFPTRAVSQKVGLDMQVFHEVVGGPRPDEAELLDAALDAASRKVVVKRPRKAPPLGGRRPSSTLEKKTSRFDVYAVG